MLDFTKYISANIAQHRNLIGPPQRHLFFVSASPTNAPPKLYNSMTNPYYIEPSFLRGATSWSAKGSPLNAHINNSSSYNLYHTDIKDSLFSEKFGMIVTSSFSAINSTSAGSITPLALATWINKAGQWAGKSLTNCVYEFN